MWINIKSIYQKISANLYEHSYHFLLYLWTVFYLIYFLFDKYPICMKPYEILYQRIEIISLLIFIILAFMLVLHIVLYGSNDKVMLDEEHTERPARFDGGKVKYLVVPLYALMIFSISKLLLFIVDYKLSYDPFIMIWLAFLFGSSIFWKRLKHKAQKTWDLKLTIIVVIMTSVIMFWDSTFEPFVKSILVIGECVNIEILESNISKI